MTMTPQGYLMCGLVALFGMLLQILLKGIAVQKKARLANVEFKFIEIFTNDWLSHLASIVTIILALFLVDEFTNISEKVTDYIRIGFAFVGYTGSDIASRLFSVVNSKVNAAIDYKTTIADQANNTTDKPTPK